MTSTISFNIRDHSEEYSRVAINIPDVNGTSWDAINTQVLAAQAAIAALTMGEIANKQLVAYNTVVSTAIPSDAAAQRELGLRLFYRDLDSAYGAGKKFHITIPCPDVDLVAQAGTNEVDITGVAVVSAVVTALEAFMVSPYGGTVEFYSGVIVGRNN